MANEITTVEKIELPDTQRPGKPVSLPHWARVRLDSLKKAEQPDRFGRYRMTLVLPAPLILTPAQRDAIDQYQSAVAHVLEQTPERDGRWSQRTLVCVSKLLMALAGREGGDLAGEAKGAAYMAALDDVPYWATEEAARLWYRGECGGPHDYNWPPAPAILRGIARRSEYGVRSRSAQLQQLLCAEVERVIGIVPSAAVPDGSCVDCVPTASWPAVRSSY